MFYLFLHGPTQLLNLLAFVALTRADYWIDDSNTSALTYGWHPSAPHAWTTLSGSTTEILPLANGTELNVVHTSCYNNSYTFAPCDTSDGCSVKFNFNGSGATIYVLVAGQTGINSSISVDNAPEIISALPAADAPYFLKANVSLFDVQSLTSGLHTVTLTLLSWNDKLSGMFLDSVSINETIVSTPTSTSMSTASATSSMPTAATTSVTSNSSSHSKSNTGAIVGGVVGGLVVIAVMIIGILFCRRRKPNTVDNYHREAPSDSNINPATIIHSSFSTPNNPDTTISRPQTEVLAGPEMVQTTSRHATKSAANSTFVAATSQEQSSTPRMTNMSPLTNNQVDFVNNLHRNNIPSPAIAHIIEGMLGTGSTSVAEDVQANDDVRSLGPPSYEVMTG